MNSKNYLPYFIEDFRPKPKRRDYLKKLLDADTAALVEYSRMPIELQYFMIHSITLESVPILFLKNSKAGCTSMAHMIFEGYSGHSCGGVIHEERTMLVQGLLGWRSIQRRLTQENVFTFSILRMPTSRIVSCFIDFIAEKRNPGAHKLKRFIEDFDLENRSPSYQFSAFLDAIDAWAEHSEATMDRHWRPQYKNLASDYVDYNFLGRLEEISDWYSALRCNLKKNGLKLPSSPILKNSASIEMQIGKNQQKSIERIYARDFELYENSRLT